ncbi:carbohydrate-binding domain-containing protein [Streptococcus cameli]
MNKRLYLLAIGVVLLTTVSMGIVSYLQGDFKELEAKIIQKESKSIRIQLDGNQITTTSEDVTIDGMTVEILSGGQYDISGEAPGAKVTVSKNIKEDVSLHLQDAHFSSLDFQSKGTNILHLEKSSQNTLSDSEIAIQATNLTITGSGQLDLKSISKYGVFATEDIVVEAGEIQIDAGEFGLYGKNEAEPTHGNVMVNGGSLTIQTAAEEGTAAIYAANHLTINDGTIQIGKAFEGYVAKEIAIKGGTAQLTTISNGLVSRQDSSNPDTTSQGKIAIAGGKTKVIAGEAAILANGDLEMSNGTTVLSSQSDTQTVLNYSGSATISGGYLWSFGTTNVSSATQALVITSLVGNQGDTITLADSAGNTLATYEAPAGFFSVTVSSPELAEGETYFLSTTSGNYAQGTASMQSYSAY